MEYANLNNIHITLHFSNLKLRINYFILLPCHNHTSILSGIS